MLIQQIWAEANRYAIWLAGAAALLTWGITALGALTVFFLPRRAAPRMMDPLLAASGGVMLAASFWSLLQPAVEQARQYATPCWLVAALGFLAGGLFLIAGEWLISLFQRLNNRAKHGLGQRTHQKTSLLRWEAFGIDGPPSKPIPANTPKSRGEHRCGLLIAAITLHNIPEGLAIGVAFGALAGPTPPSAAALAGAWAVAVGIGLQNFPEGAAVSLPLLREGRSPAAAFFIGQLSGLAEPLAALLGAALVGRVRPILPWALAGAAGAMIYVAVHELIPTAQGSEGGRKGITISCMLGFTLMMVLDVALAA